MYAHVTGQTVDSVGKPPALAWDGKRWWDLRSLDPEALRATGWYPVTTTARPAETPTTTYEASYSLVSDAVVQAWVARPKTAQETAAATSDANRATIEAQAATAIQANKTFLALASPSNAQIAAQVKALTRQNNGVIRLVLGQLDAAD